MSTLYLKCEPGEIAEHVLLTGDPARVNRIATMMENARVIAQNREFYVATGDYRGKRFSVVSSGIGAPSAAIAVEELVQLGARSIVRVGTMMGIGLPMGCLVAATGAARFEGTSSAYLDMAFPAVPDWELAQCLIEAARNSGCKVYTGTTATYDAFYPKMAPSLVKQGIPDLELLRNAGVIALDMETSLLYVLGAYLRLPVVSMCLITNNADPFEVIDNDLRDRGERDLIHAVLNGLISWSSRT
ncbi:MAG: nucleoside phosphorylase [Anaerolineae bacterium]